MTRIDKWKVPQLLLPIMSVDDEEIVEALTRKQRDETTRMSQGELIRACKELIFEVRDGKPVFHFIVYSINTGAGTIEISRMMESVPEEMIDDDSYCGTLAIATAYDVPVYANEEKDSAELIRLYRKMLEQGFTLPGNDGQRVRLKLTHPIAELYDDPNYLSQASLSDSVSPAQMAVIGEAVSAKLRRLEHVDRLLDRLGKAIGEFEKLLHERKRDEERLQKFLTDNPILFGTEYRRIVPKHKLGAEFEVDYALETFHGIHEVLELEDSTLKIFTQKGRPRAELVHAEQQIFDWQEWIERNNSYACEKLPGVRSPAGWVIIGRSQDLSEEHASRLRQRNRVFGGRLFILTCDQLLERAKLLQHHLTGD